MLGTVVLNFHIAEHLSTIN